MRKSYAYSAITLSLLALAIGAAAPVNAGDTGVTFTVNAGTLSMSVPTSKSLGAASATLGGTSVSGALGATTVTDTRGSLLGTWTIGVAGTDFSDGSGNSIAKSNASVYSGAPSATTGVVVFVPTTAVNPVSLAGSGGTLATATGVVGSASVTYDPTISVTIPGNAVAGSYSGTVTQTVA